MSCSPPRPTPSDGARGCPSPGEQQMGLGARGEEVRKLTRGSRRGQPEILQDGRDSAKPPSASGSRLETHNRRGGIARSVQGTSWLPWPPAPAFRRAVAARYRRRKRSPAPFSQAVLAAIAPRSEAGCYATASLSLIPNWLAALPPIMRAISVLRHVGAGKHRDRVPCAGGVVVRIARAPDDLVGKIVRQLLDQPLLGVKAQHDVAVLPHLFGCRSRPDIGAAAGSTRVEASIFSSTSSIHEALPCATTTFIAGIALHDREADQRRGDEHVVVQPVATGSAPADGRAASRAVKNDCSPGHRRRRQRPAAARQ